MATADINKTGNEQARKRRRQLERHGMQHEWKTDDGLDDYSNTCH